jgi:hypothetical protein
MSILLSVAASLLLSYGGAFGVEAVFERHAQTKQDIAQEVAQHTADETTTLSELTGGHIPR